MTLRAPAGGLVLAAAAAVSISSAVAADLPVPARAPAPVAPVAYAPEAIYNWTGFYIGGHVGGGFANSSWSDPFTGANNSFNSTGFLGGAQVGANVQFNRLVLGVEGDFSYTGIGLKGSGTDSIGNAINTDVNWTSTVTGRVGAAFDRLLLYGKGGIALAQDQSGFTDVFGKRRKLDFPTDRLDRRRRHRIRAQQELVRQARIRLSRLRLASAQLFTPDHSFVQLERRSRRARSQSGHQLPVRRPLSA